MSELEELADSLHTRGLTLSVAESLTSGNLAAQLGAASEASDWFRGGVVAYMNSVKFDVLDVAPGPVVTAGTAHQMAIGVRALLRSDVAIGVTGVGGPGPSEGQPAGTVFIAVLTPRRAVVEHEAFNGTPEDVLRLTIQRTIALVLRELRE